MNNTEYQPLIEQIHARGVERHRGMWLEANRLAVEAMWKFGINPAEQQMKVLVSTIVLCALDLATYSHRHDHYLLRG